VTHHHSRKESSVPILLALGTNWRKLPIIANKKDTAECFITKTASDFFAKKLIQILFAYVLVIFFHLQKTKVCAFVCIVQISAVMFKFVAHAGNEKPDV